MVKSVDRIIGRQPFRVAAQYEEPFSDFGTLKSTAPMFGDFASPSDFDGDPLGSNTLGIDFEDRVLTGTDNTALGGNVHLAEPNNPLAARKAENIRKRYADAAETKMQRKIDETLGPYETKHVYYDRKTDTLFLLVREETDYLDDLDLITHFGTGIPYASNEGPYAIVTIYPDADRPEISRGYQWKQAIDTFLIATGRRAHSRQLSDAPSRTRNP